MREKKITLNRPINQLDIICAVFASEPLIFIISLHASYGGLVELCYQCMQIVLGDTKRVAKYLGKTALSHFDQSEINVVDRTFFSH